MIVPSGPDVWRMVTYIGRPVLLLALWDIAVVFAYRVLDWSWVGSSVIPLALYGSVIGIVVGFRNNSAYARWWEARTLWGSIVNNTRSVGRQVSTMLDSSGDDDKHAVSDLRRRLLYHTVAFVHALRQQLRGLDPFAEIGGLLSAEELASLRGAPNVALTIQLRMADLLREARDRNWIDTLEWQAIDRNLDDLADAQGGAERIKSTPIPKQYDYFPMLFVRVYCLLLPCGMVPQLGWFTPIGSTLVGFMFLALEKIGRDVENPFENTVFDIPMTSICRNIEIQLRHMLGESKLPEPIKPVDGVLW